MLNFQQKSQQVLIELKILKGFNKSRNFMAEKKRKLHYSNELEEMTTMIYLQVK